MRTRIRPVGEERAESDGLKGSPRPPASELGNNGQPGTTRIPYIALAIALVIGSLAASVVSVDLHRSSTIAAGVPMGPTDHVFVFVIDGVSGPALSSARLPVISGLGRQGMVYSNAWLGQLEASALPSLVSLGTGTFPDRHGVVGKRWRDPHAAALVSAVSPEQVQLGALDQIMESRGTTPLARLLKEQMPSARVLSVAGSCSAANAAGTWVADFVLCAARDKGHWRPAAVTGHSPASGLPQGASWAAKVASGPSLGAQTQGWAFGREDDWIARYAAWAISRTKPRLTIVDFPELNSVRHFAPAATEASLTRKILTGIDRDIGRILAELRREGVVGRSVFIVTSDQAVEPISGTVSQKSLEEGVVAAGGLALYTDAEGAAYLGLKDQLQSSPVAQSLQAEQIPRVDAIFYKTQARGAWKYRLQYVNPQLPAHLSDAFTYLVGTLANDVSPDVVVLYAPRTGTGHLTLGSYQRTGASLGAQWDNQSIPLIVSGNGVPTGGTASFPARLVDVAPTLAEMLNLHPSGFDGTALADAMFDPPQDLVRSQRAAARQLTPLVNALKQRSASAR